MQLTTLTTIRTNTTTYRLALTSVHVVNDPVNLSSKVKRSRSILFVESAICRVQEMVCKKCE